MSDFAPPREERRPPDRLVLLVEDVAADRYVVQRRLEEWSQLEGRRRYTVIAAETGAAGLELCRTHRPDCILLDFYLPDMTGFDFLEALGAGPDPISVPVAMLTSRDDDGIAASALQRGAQDFLIKSAISAHSLVRAIENAIEKYQYLRTIETDRSALRLQNEQLQTMRGQLESNLSELGDATKTKDRFLAVMSHEMRTPLNAILGYAELLDLELEGQLTDGQRHQVERIRVGSRHLLGLTNDVLDLARADSNRLELDLRPVDLNGVCEEVVILLEREAQEKGLTLELHPCPADRVLVRADLQRLRQIITNLVGNAIKFTERGSVDIRCIVDRADGLVALEVRDTGIGIEPEVLPRVFDEFYQAKSDFTRVYGGTGLGLAIAKRFARLMDGDIAATSQPGRGSTFTLLIPPAIPGSEPRWEDVAQHDARMAAAQLRPSRSDGESTVSVVAYASDAEALAELERRLSRRVRFAWTTDPEAVPRMATENHAALVVLDAGSGSGAAWRIANVLQDIPDLASASVLLLPSLSAALPGEGPDMLDLGWVSLVPKPFTAQQLRQAVETAGRGGSPLVNRDSVSALHVLVIDDDLDSRRVAERALRQQNVVVREASSGEEAILEMRRQPPDVVVLDLMMPVLDGFGVLAAMRIDPLLASIPVVVLTAKSLTEAEREFLSRSSVRVLQKGAHRLSDIAALVMRAVNAERKA